MRFNPAMSSPESTRFPVRASVLVGFLLLLVYVLPSLWPPPPRAITPATITTPPLERLFPHVPAWWLVGRLAAVLAGAALVGASIRAPVLRWDHDRPESRDVAYHPLALRAACAAAGLQLACLPIVRGLPIWAKTAYLLWIVVPSAVLLLGRRPSAIQVLRSGARQPAVLATITVVAVWAATRLLAAWHSPIAADCVDMFRTLGGLVRFATTDADFMRDSMGVTEGVGDIEVVGVNAVQLFFEGLPILRYFEHVPGMWWMQVANTIWVSLGAVLVSWLCRTLISRAIMPFAAAAYLFSPFAMMTQILPIPTVCVPLAVLVVLLPVRFYLTGSPLALMLVASVAGLTATLPSQSLMTGIAGLFVLWTLWRRHRPPWLTIAGSCAAFVAVCAPNIPSRTALQLAYDWYVTKSWPIAVGEATLQGQVSPSVIDWTTVDPPGRWLLIAGSVLSPVAIPRFGLRNWGDVLYEPMSAALGVVGLVLCLRRVNRNGPGIYLLVMLAAGLVPGFVSSYDRVSLTRVYGSAVAWCVLSAGGFAALLRALTPRLSTRAVVLAFTLAVAASGTFVFDYVNPRIVSSSPFGLIMRAVEPTMLPRVAMLTAYGDARHTQGVDDRHRLWEADWLMRHHPYIREIARSAPQHPIPLLPIDNTPAEQAQMEGFDLLFWNPALDQTIAITATYVCRRWPNATLYTIYDQAGLSKVYAAQLHGQPWVPRVARSQWTTLRCGAADDPRFNAARTS